MAFAVVKNAGVNWEYYYLEDPKVGKLHPSHSCHGTHTGKLLDIKPSYETREQAQHDCDTINSSNPVGDYAVCEIE